MTRNTLKLTATVSHLGSVKTFADRASKLDRIDVLLENAGIATKHWSISEGYERTITVNVISTFLLALLLLPKLKSTARQFNIEPRITIVSSEVHAWTKFPEWTAPSAFDALNNKEKTNFEERYPTSKLLEVLVVRHIAPQLEGSGVVLNYLNPGLCRSSLGRDGNFILAVMYFIRLPRTTEVGSRTLVAGAAAGRESHGKYMTDGKTDDSALGPFPRSTDGKKASEKIWGELARILERVQPGITAGF
jgi:NAD(P)-dependent dehydrogenase (short-subunit alcohol dehydrogenase family)